MLRKHPHRDSNPESPAPEADALSIRPHAQYYILEAIPGSVSKPVSYYSYVYLHPT